MVMVANHDAIMRVRAVCTLYWLMSVEAHTQRFQNRLSRKGTFPERIKIDFVHENSDEVDTRSSSFRNVRDTHGQRSGQSALLTPESTIHSTGLFKRYTAMHRQKSKQKELPLGPCGPCSPLCPSSPAGPLAPVSPFGP